MKTRLVRILIVPLVAMVVSFGFVQTSYAAYGTGNYGACAYQSQTDCSTTSSAGAPNTGQESVSLLWPAILGVVGVCLVGFVVIRYFNRDRALKK